MLNKVKNWLGIEGVAIEIIDAVADEENKKVDVAIRLTSQSAQELDAIRLIVKEKYKRGRRKSKMVDEYTLGEKVIDVDISITPDEEIDLRYDIKYDLLLSEMDRMTTEGNILSKGLGHLAKLIKNAQSEYFVLAEVHVKGNRLRPYDKFLIEDL